MDESIIVLRDEMANEFDNVKQSFETVSEELQSQINKNIKLSC